MADDRRRKAGEDYVESERTIPAGMRREAPRIATPLAPELKPGLAAAQSRRPASTAAMPPVDTATPVPAGPVTLPAPGPFSAVPVPVMPERSSRNVAQAPGAPDRASRNIGPIIERVRERGPDDRLRESDDQRPVMPAPQMPSVSPPLAPPLAPPLGPPMSTTAPMASIPAPISPAQHAHAAAAVLTHSGQHPSVDGMRQTLMSPPPNMMNMDVRVHRLPPPPRFDDRLYLLRAPDSPAAASFRVLRHRLAENKGLKVILITSPGKGEGKTLCAVNLALALGEAGRARVLLLETNFRRPAIAQLLGFRPPICFSEQLEFHHARPGQPWAVVENMNPWLHTAAVSIDAPGRPILDGPAITQCILELRGAGYDYIVLDSPPVLGSADVNLIEESVDGILFCLWAKRSRARALRKAIEQVGSDKVLGVALLGTP